MPTTVPEAAAATFVPALIDPDAWLIMALPAVVVPSTLMRFEAGSIYELMIWWP